MDTEELNRLAIALVQSPHNMQEFANLASLDENWERIEQNKVTLPRNVGFTADECPACEGTVRLIYEKFATADYEVPLTCPHCRAPLKCVGEFTGYTNDVHLEEA